MKYFFETKRKSIEIMLRDTLDFNAHLHDKIEISYLKEGSCNLYVDNVKYHANKGDFILIFPNQIHSYENSDRVISTVIIFDAELVSEFTGVLLKKIPVSPVIGNASIISVQLTEIFSQVINGANNETMHGLVLALFSQLMDAVELKKTDLYNIGTIKNLLIYCDEHYTEHINIDNVSKELHISRSHISHIFKNKLHSTFERYIAEKRINYSCSLLKCCDASVTDIAYMSGFNSIRTFNRAFVKYIGCSPREFKKTLTLNPPLPCSAANSSKLDL